MSRAVMKQALSALTYQGTMGPTRRQRRHAAIADLQAALAQPEPEPVAEVAGEWNAMHIKFLQAGINLRLGDKLYAAAGAAPVPNGQQMLDTLREVHAWLVCAPIATNDDMAESFEYMEKLIYATVLAAAPKEPS